jgi:hypothetical protein
MRGENGFYLGDLVNDVFWLVHRVLPRPVDRDAKLKATRIAGSE